MYPIEDIIALINNNTIYTAELSKSKLPAPINDVDLPRIYVGYYTIGSPSGTTEESREIVAQSGENLTQSFHVTIGCRIADLPTIWRAVHTALVGKNTRPLEEQVSGLGYGKGGVIGLDNDKIWWVDRWDLDFPTINIF